MAQVVLEQLIPAVDLSVVSKRTSDRQERQELEERSRLILAPLNAPTSPFAHLSSEQLQEIEKVAIECAMLWKLTHLVWKGAMDTYPSGITVGTILVSVN